MNFAFDSVLQFFGLVNLKINFVSSICSLCLRVALVSDAVVWFSVNFVSV